jgi:ubiquinone/menaquinone biosynthesis C-methylase UbiE
MKSEAPHAGQGAEFDAYSRNYDEEVNRALAFSGLTIDLFTRAKSDYLLDLIRVEPGCGSDAALLDIGCGVGNNHSLLAGKVARLVGIDVSGECVAVAQERHPGLEYKMYDGIHIPYPDRSFDAAFTICVLHHVPVVQRPALIGEIRRVLKPGGLFVIFEHNPRNPLTMRVVNRCEFDRDAVLLRRQESESLMHGAGFSRIESRFILAVPPVNSVLKKLDRAFARLPLGAQYFTAGRA